MFGNTSSKSLTTDDDRGAVSSASKKKKRKRGAHEALRKDFVGIVDKADYQNKGGMQFIQHKHPEIKIEMQQKMNKTASASPTSNGIISSFPNIDKCPNHKCLALQSSPSRANKRRNENFADAQIVQQNIL